MVELVALYVFICLLIVHIMDSYDFIVCLMDRRIMVSSGTVVQVLDFLNKS